MILIMNMDLIDDEIISKELDLISKLKQQNSILKNELEERKRMIQTIQESKNTLENNFSLLKSKNFELESKMSEMQNSMAKSTALNVKIQKKLENGENEKLELLHNFESFSEKWQKQVQTLSSKIQFLENDNNKIVLESIYESEKLKKDLDLKDIKIESLIQEQKELFLSNQEKISEMKCLYSKDVELLKNTISNNSNEFQQLKKQDEIKTQKIDQLLIEIEGLNHRLKADFKNETGFNTKLEIATEKIKNLEKVICDEKKQREELKTAQIEEKSKLKNKFKERLRKINEEFEDKTLETILDYKNECNSLKTENKSLTLEINELKCQLNLLKSTVGVSKKHAIENNAVLDKVFKMERKKDQEIMGELENKILILEAEKSEIVGDLDKIQARFDKIQQENFLFAKENKLLLTKIVNFTDYPALKNSFHSDFAKNEEEKISKLKKNDHKSVQKKTKWESRSENNSDEDFLHESKFFDKNISLTPSIFRENKLKTSNFKQKRPNVQKIEDLKCIPTINYQNPQDFSDQPSALKFIKSLKRINDELNTQLSQKNTELIEIQSLIKDMTLKMQEMSSYVGTITSENNSIKQQFTLVQEKLNTMQSEKVLHLKETLEMNSKLNFLEKNNAEIIAKKDLLMEVF